MNAPDPLPRQLAPLIDDLAAVIARYPNVTGREFVQAAMQVAEAYFESSDLPTLIDVDELGAALRTELNRSANGFSTLPAEPRERMRLRRASSCSGSAWSSSATPTAGSS
ncbi:MAG: hypothetical protein KJ011_01740 [Burkholderiaceae bacterium]|nr:hypothetical protein [Burkholderiaceae bacterium]